MKANAALTTFLQSALIAVVLLSFAFFSNAQKLDSLKGALTEYSNNDSNKVNLMLRLGKEYQGMSLDSMWNVTTRALTLAQKIKYSKGEADALVQQAYVCVYKTETDRAIELVRQADKIYEGLNDYVGRIKVANLIAIVYYRKVNYDSALAYFEKILTLADEGNALDHKGKTLVSIGTIYVEQGNYFEAVKYYLEGLKVQEKINDKENMCITLSRIASTYATIKDKKKALEYINRCLSFLGTVKDAPMRMSTYANIGSVYGTIEDNNNALIYFKKALEIADSTHDPYWHNIALVDIAEIYYQQKIYDKALDAYRQSMDGAEKINQFNIYSSAKLGVGRVLMDLHKPAEAVKYLSESYDMFVKAGVKEQMREAALSLSEAYEQLHDYKKSLDFHKIYVDIKDSIKNDKVDQKVQQLQFDYQLQKKQNQIELLNKDKQLAQSRSKEQRAINVGLVSGVVLLLAILILLYRSRQHERNNKEMILKQKEEIQQQATELHQLNLFKDKTFSVLSHDLRGPLHALTSTMELFAEELLTPEDMKDVGTTATRQLRSLNLLLDNLLRWSKSHMQGDVPVRKEVVDMGAVASQNVDLFRHMAEQKSIAVSSNVPQGVLVSADASQMDVIVRNLVNNAIKFTGKGGNVNVSAQRENGHVKISVSDTGVGIDKERINKLFTSSLDNNTYGTGGEKGVGLGLLLCYEFVKANDGNIEVHSTPGQGSSFTVTLPAA